MLLEPTALAAMPAALGEALLFPDLDQDAYRRALEAISEAAGVKRSATPSPAN